MVEFGSGSGNLVLALANLFPDMSFTAVDMKPSAVQLLQQRVDAAGLQNVNVQLGRIESYTGEHCCQLSLMMVLNAMSASCVTQELVQQAEHLTRALYCVINIGQTNSKGAIGPLVRCSAC